MVIEDNYKKQIREYTGTGAGGGNATDGNDITSQRHFEDDEDETEIDTVDLNAKFDDVNDYIEDYSS